MATNDFINGVPAWTIGALGDLVKLTAMVDFYRDGTVVFQPGWVGTLDAIQAGEDGPHALVEDLNTGVLVEVPFDYLETVK